jgi:hypothetical protein
MGVLGRVRTLVYFRLRDKYFNLSTVKQLV